MSFNLDSMVCFLLIVAALNWGMVGFFDFNLVTFFSFGNAMVGKFLYGMIGFAGLYKAYGWMTGASCMGE